MLAWRTAYQMNSRGEKQREKQQLFGKAIIQCFPKLESHRSDRSHYVADFSTALLDRSSMQKPDGILISADTLLYGSRPDYSRSTSDSLWKYRLGASMCRKGVALSALLTKQSEHSSRGICPDRTGIRDDYRPTRPACKAQPAPARSPCGTKQKGHP